MLLRLASLVLPLLLVAATPTPTLVQHADNVLGSMQAEADDLATLVASVQDSSARLQASPGQAEILALHADAHRIDRSCEALRLKAARLEEIAGELEQGLATAEQPLVAE